MESEKLKIRPYARLLTMLGDQLIKNERIALVELIKNSYDADADWVKVRFENFNPDMSNKEDSRIVVHDNGSGMGIDTIRKHWMNPAAPNKYLQKRKGTPKTPKKQRIMQGEKGIGRFAILKLGRVIRITTRAEREDLETTLTYDFSRFDDEFLSQDGKGNEEIFLDDIEIECYQTSMVKRLIEAHGTEIAISNLKGAWTNTLIDHLCSDVNSLTDPVSRLTGRKGNDGFDIQIYCNHKRRPIDNKETKILRSLIESKSILDIKGGFNSEKMMFSFQNKPQEWEQISLDDPKITGKWVWKQMVRKEGEHGRKFDCGNFDFQFYIFDFARGIGGRQELSTNEKNLLKRHRIYLYRDDMRVYPYGDPDDDWLNIDVDRGTGRAGDFFSNDQVVGWVDITQEGNPKLRDKTNREGLIETDGAADDFKLLVRTFLSYIRQHHYARHQQQQQRRREQRDVQDDRVSRLFKDLMEALSELENRSYFRKVEKVQVEYLKEKEYLSHRIEVTEDLAGVGLSVEMASHDIMLLMSRAVELGTDITLMVKDENFRDLQRQTDTLIDVLHQVMDGLHDVQGLFKSSLRRQRLHEVVPILDKVHKIYSGLLERSEILYRKNLIGSSPLKARTTDGLLMQVLINLFDNASYWLDTVDSAEREICVTVDGYRKELIFSDNGPSIDDEDLPYIFEPFYSAKGEEGRGLGLYIARKLLERHGFEITVAAGDQKILSGANFVISFEKEEQL